MIRLALILAIIAAVTGGFFMVWSTAYNAGVSECQRKAIIEAEQSRKNTQSIIDSIEKNALEKIAKQTATNVEKAIADARKANPTCSLIVPAIVRDQLKRGPK